MEQINKLFYLLFSIILFCIGLALLIFEDKSYHNSLTTIRDGAKEAPLYEQYNREEGNKVTYGWLIASLMYPLDIDIVINDCVIRAAEHDAGKIEGYSISQTNFEKNYIYDEEGNITMVTYKSIPGKE